MMFRFLQIHIYIYKFRLMINAVELCTYISIYTSVLFPPPFKGMSFDSLNNVMWILRHPPNVQDKLHNNFRSFVPEAGVKGMDK